MLAQLGGGGRAAGGGDDIADQAPVAAGGGERQHHRLPHRRMTLQGDLDLPQLDAEAADLDLVVDPAEELQVAVGEVARAVAGAVEARAGVLRTGATKGSGTKRSAVRAGRWA